MMAAMISDHPGRRDGKVISCMARRYGLPRGLGAVGVGDPGIGIPAAPLPRPEAGGIGPGPPGAPPLPDVVVSMRPAIIPEADPARRNPTNAAMVAPATDSTRPTNALARPCTLSRAKMPTPSPIRAATGILTTPRVLPPAFAISTKS